MIIAEQLNVIKGSHYPMILTKGKAKEKKEQEEQEKEKAEADFPAGLREYIA